MCLAVQHTTFCLDKHNFWHYVLVVNPLNYYVIFYLRLSNPQFIIKLFTFTLFVITKTIHV
jgi:hypothetical protein